MVNSEELTQLENEKGQQERSVDGKIDKRTHEATTNALIDMETREEKSCRRKDQPPASFPFSLGDRGERGETICLPKCSIISSHYLEAERRVRLKEGESERGREKWERGESTSVRERGEAL